MNIIKSDTGRARGFTLIELLVVIAIIAILAAILFPVFAKVREKARQITCTSNMKELGLGMMEYVQDNDERFPGGFTPGPAGSASAGAASYFPLENQITGQVTDYGNGDQWAQQIYPYVKSKGVYVCPDDTTAPSQSQQSYAYNYNMAGQSEASLSAPASTVNLFECGITSGYAGSDPSTFNSFSAAAIMDFNQYFVGINVEPGVGGYASTPAGTDRHTNGDNWLAADGHVKFLVGPQVSFGGTPLKDGCTQYYASTGPGCGAGSYISATSTDTMLLQDGVSKVQMTWSTL